MLELWHLITGDADISNESTTTKGNESRKSSATYRFTRTINSGGPLENSTDYSITLSCDYKGNDS